MTSTTEVANPYAGRDLTREAIIDMATTLVRESGVERLSMRRLAAELGVTATALYYHVGSKDTLLDAVLSGLLAEVADCGQGLAWDRQLEELLVRLQYLASEIPGMQRYMAAHLQSSATLLWIEMILKVLKAGGLDDSQAATAFSIVGFYNSAVPLRSAAVHAGPWEAADPAGLAPRLSEVGKTYPTLAAMVGSLKQPDEAVFRLGLKNLIAGLTRHPPPCGGRA